MAELEEKSWLQREEEERKKAIDDRIQKLSGRSIADLVSLREHWVSERRRNTRVYEPYTTRRREAILWIEAIDELLTSQNLPAAEKPKKVSDVSLIGNYLNAVLALKMSTPRLYDLEDASGISTPTWSRRLRDPAFVMALKEAIKKKVNYAKKEKTETFWRLAEAGVDEVINKIHDSLRYMNNPIHGNPAAPPSVPKGIVDPEIGDIMEEDIGRRGAGESEDDD